MCRSIDAGGRRCPGGWCAEDRRAAQRAYTARVRAWRREERAALAEVDDEQTRSLIAEAVRAVVLTPDERQHLRSKRIARIKRQARPTKRGNTPAPDPETLTDETQPPPDANTIRQALLADPEHAADLARRIAHRTDLSPEARATVSAATAADAAGGDDVPPFLDRVLDGAASRSPEAASARGRVIAEAAREFGAARDADERVDAAARRHDADTGTGGESPAADRRGGPGGSAGGDRAGDRPGGAGGSESGRVGDRPRGDGLSGVPGDAISPGTGHPDAAISTPVADALAGIPEVGAGASPEDQRRAAEALVGRVQAARPGGKPFIPSPSDVAAILRRLLGIGSRLSPAVIVTLAARAVTGLITGDDSVSQMTGADGSGTVWLSMDQADIGDVEQAVTDPRAERWTVGPMGDE